MSDGASDNPVVQILASEHPDENVAKTLTFLYLLAVIPGVKKSNNLVHTIALSFLRAFGSQAFCLPLVLGNLPGYAGFDNQVLLLLAALFTCRILADRFIPKDLWAHSKHLTSLGHAIYKGNAAGAGYVVMAGALPNSQVAPLVGAYLAVNGHRLLEDGMSALNTAEFNDDSLLAIFGGLIYLGLTEHAGVAANLARVALVVLRFSCNYVDYNEYLNKVCSCLNGGGKSAGGRNRSRTPKRK